MELLHTATLVHDDVIDAATERRGRPTTAALFNNGPAVMLGDYMFAHAAEFVARTGNVRVIRNFAATLGAMANGELTQDMSAFEYSEDVQRYLDRIFGKTASLFATAAEGGAIVCGGGRKRAWSRCAATARRWGWRSRSSTTSWTSTATRSRWANRWVPTYWPGRSRCHRCSTCNEPRTTTP